MTNTITLSESESQYLADLLLKQIKLLADVLGDKEAEAYLKKIDKDHVYRIYKKVINY